MFDPDGHHAFTVLVKAHQADIGNSIPTTYFVTARDVYEEGALIFPNLRVARADGPNEDFIRLCQMRIRAPEQWKGDFLAMLGAARCGERDLMQLGTDHGWDKLRAFSTQWLDYSERMMRSAISRLPAASAKGSSTHDPMPGTPASGVRMGAEVSLRPASSEIVVDASANPDVLPNGLNLSEACARTAVLIGIFNSIPENIPKNAGAFRPIEIKLRQGSCAGGAAHPASCSAATTNLADRLTAAVQLAFGQIGQGLGMAEIGPVNPPSKGVLSGVDPRTEKFVVTQLFLGSTGGAANAFSDGWLTHSHAGNAGMSLVESVELAELYLPIVVRERSLIADTEGAGEYIGAPALRTVVEGDADGLRIVYASDGTVSAAQGVDGGHAGWNASAELQRKGQAPESLPNVGAIELMRGDRVVSIGTGGGGYGDPSCRPVEKLRTDVENGLLSPERMQAVYGREITRTSSDGILAVHADEPA